MNITKVMYKVYLTINSCSTAKELQTAENMMNNFFKMYGYSHFLAVILSFKKLTIKN